MPNRFLVLTELFLPTKGGTAVWFDEVYRRLGGREIHIVTADVPGAADHDLDHPNSIHRLGLKRVPWLRPESLAMYLKFLLVSLSLALTRRFDAVHAGRALPEGLVAWLVARLTGRPVVIYAHGEELTGWGRGNKYRAMSFALRRADLVVANSEFTQQILTGMGISAGRIHIIHPGVDTERFRPGLPCQDLRQSLGLVPGAWLVLSVGRLSRRKGFDQVIRCMPEIVRTGRDVHYAIVGIGEDQDYLSALVDQLELRGRVHLLGHVPMEDLPRWYNACDLFVLANRDIEGDTEGFGIVFLEAAACGKAAIAGKAGGTGAAVLDGETGVRVDAGSSVELQRVLVTLLDNASARQAMGEAGLVRVRSLLNWDAVARRTRELRLPKGARRGNV